MSFPSPEAFASKAYAPLTQEQIGQLGRFGETRDTTAGDVLFATGERVPSLVVVLEGRVEVRARSDGDPRTILSVGPGQFVGELS